MNFWILMIIILIYIIRLLSYLISYSEIHSFF
jgi:Na+-transporting methylmalonyl-CoA/oxaloacetate decarboxylase gamma subunit